MEAGGASELDAERMEEAADRLVDEMSASGLFTSARSQVSEAEMLQLARFYVESFPAFADPGQRSKLAARLSPAGAREHVRQAAEGLLTPFSTLGPEYFVLDPLGLLEFVDPASRDAGGFAGFDLDWGSGGRFFSRDHRALLVIAEPREPASDYEFAVRLMTWTRSRIAAILAEAGPGRGAAADDAGRRARLRRPEPRPDRAQHPRGLDRLGDRQPAADRASSIAGSRRWC